MKKEDYITILDTFRTTQGQRTLEILKNLTIEQPSLSTIGTDGVNTAIIMALKEGEKNFYHRLINIINKAKKL